MRKYTQKKRGNYDAAFKAEALHQIQDGHGVVGVARYTKPIEYENLICFAIEANGNRTIYFPTSGKVFLEGVKTIESLSTRPTDIEIRDLVMSKLTSGLLMHLSPLDPAFPRGINPATTRLVPTNQ